MLVVKPRSTCFKPKSDGFDLNLCRYSILCNDLIQSLPNNNFLMKYSLNMFCFSSEEQIKVFSLPKISAKRKFKLTAIDGSLVRRVVFANFQSTKNPDYLEYGLVCLTNLGVLVGIKCNI